MYNFFRSKEELLHELMQRGLADIRASMQSYAKEKDAKTAIAAHVRDTIRIIRIHKEFWRLVHTIRLQGEVAKAMRGTFGELVMNVTQTFRRVFTELGYQRPDLEAMLFLAQIDGLVILFLQDQHTPIEELGEQLIQRYTK